MISCQKYLPIISFPVFLNVLSFASAGINLQGVPFGLLTVEISWWKRRGVNVGCFYFKFFFLRNFVSGGEAEMIYWTLKMRERQRRWAGGWDEKRGLIIWVLNSSCTPQHCLNTYRMTDVIHVKTFLGSYYK